MQADPDAKWRPMLAALRDLWVQADAADAGPRRADARPGGSTDHDVGMASAPKALPKDVRMHLDQAFAKQVGFSVEPRDACCEPTLALLRHDAEKKAYTAHELCGVRCPVQFAHAPSGTHVPTEPNKWGVRDLCAFLRAHDMYMNSVFKAAIGLAWRPGTRLLPVAGVQHKMHLQLDPQLRHDYGATSMDESLWPSWETTMLVKQKVQNEFASSDGGSGLPLETLVSCELQQRLDAANYVMRDSVSLDLALRRVLREDRHFGKARRACADIKAEIDLAQAQSRDPLPLTIRGRPSRSPKRRRTHSPRRQRDYDERRRQDDAEARRAYGGIAAGRGDSRDRRRDRRDGRDRNDDRARFYGHGARTPGGDGAGKKGGRGKGGAGKAKTKLTPKAQWVQVCDHGRDKGVEFCRKWNHGSDCKDADCKFVHS